MAKEYWYVEYLEHDESIGEWEEKVTCIARHPDTWLKCKQEHNQGMMSMKTDWYVNTSWKILNSHAITESDYESFMNESVVGRMRLIDG